MSGDDWVSIWSTCMGATLIQILPSAFPVRMFCIIDSMKSRISGVIDRRG